MHAKNYKEVNIAKASFFFFFLILVCTIVACVSMFFRTTSAEVVYVMEKTNEYDRIQIRQVDLTEKADSLFNLLQLVNSRKISNNVLLINHISAKKDEFNKSLSNVNPRDYAIYLEVAKNVNMFLGIKDSIYTATVEKEMVEKDLNRCISDNREITRKMASGGLTYRR